MKTETYFCDRCGCEFVGDDVDRIKSERALIYKSEPNYTREGFYAIRLNFRADICDKCLAAILYQLADFVENHSYETLGDRASNCYRLS